MIKNCDNHTLECTEQNSFIIHEILMAAVDQSSKFVLYGSIVGKGGDLNDDRVFSSNTRTNCKSLELHQIKKSKDGKFGF
ncbi:MAG: hypothetical protein GY861_16865 [bacterium]|nr:hypothetical protein [bacterium]